jgi:hypothetical protein
MTAVMRWLFVFALVAAACTGSARPPTTLPQPLPGDAGSLSTVPGKLLVLDAEHTISIIRPDGSDYRRLAGADPGIEARTQPTWSPDGGRVAWTERMVDGASSLITASTRGEILTRDPAPFLAVYLAWDPTGQAIALSGHDEEGRLQLGLSHPGTGVTTIDEGAPLWLDWGPDGTELLLHVEDRLELVPIDGTERQAIGHAGRFRVGLHAGDALLYAQGGATGEVLVVGDRAGSVRRELLRVGDPTAFVSDPAGERIAVMSAPSAATQAMARVEGGDPPVLDPNRLVIVHLADGTVQEVVRGRAVAWFWSPDGNRLLYSTIVYDQENLPLRWYVWDGQSSAVYATFTPTGVFGRDYLAFFDQFDRSLTLWAPDGSAFVYAGGSSLEDSGVWVQPVAEESPVRVARGTMASWSPTP